MNNLAVVDNAITNYDVMCSAIAECHKVDEVKELRDQARALEVYAKQALNHEAEIKACQIRIRAERKAGQLLGVCEKSKGSPGNQYMDSSSDTNSPSEFKQAKESSNISNDQAAKWQKLSTIPDKEFEESLETPYVLSTDGVLRANNLGPKPFEPSPIHVHVLDFIVAIRGFNQRVERGNLDFVIKELRDYQRADALKGIDTIQKTCQLIMEKVEEYNDEKSKRPSRFSSQSD